MNTRMSTAVTNVANAEANAVAKFAAEAAFAEAASAERATYECKLPKMDTSISAMLHKGTLATSAFAKEAFAEEVASPKYREAGSDVISSAAKRMRA